MSINAGGMGSTSKPQITMKLKAFNRMANQGIQTKGWRGRALEVFEDDFEGFKKETFREEEKMRRGAERLSFGKKGYMYPRTENSLRRTSS